MTHVSIRRVPAPRPRFGKIPAAIAYSALGRNKLYELAAAHRGLFKKSGRATLVDFAVLDAILDRLPAAEMGRNPVNRNSTKPKARRAKHRSPKRSK